MKPASSSDHIGRTKTSTSQVVDTDTQSSEVMRLAASVMRCPLFSATELIDFGVDLARIFRSAATLCERGSVTATSAEICEGTVEEQSFTPTFER